MMVPGADEGARRFAIEAVDHNILVEAGAGSGKTTLLVERAVHALTAGGIAPRQLVLITFMEKAAAEIRERLRSRLAAIATRHPTPAGRRRAQRALARGEEITVNTIHGFAAAILREFAVPAGIAPGFRILSGREAEEGLRAVWREWLAQAPTALSELLEELTLMGVRLGQLEKVAAALAALPEPAPPAAATPDLAAFFRRLRETLPALAAAATGVAEDGEPGLVQIRTLAEWVAEAASQSPAAWGWWLWHMPSLSPRGALARWRDPDRLRRQKAVLRALESERRALREAYADALVARWLGWVVQDFIPRWRRWRRQQQALTFDDLLWECRKLLAHVPEARRELHQRWTAVLVDEFQDTDPLQVEILLRLACPPEGDEWTRKTPVPGRLFLVGDPKQAIYRFRGADVATYWGVRERLAAAPKSAVVAITRNFRSAPAVVDYVNTLFSRWLGTPAEESGQAPFTPLEAARAQTGPGTRVFVHQAPGPPDLDGCRRQEAEVAAAFIARVVGEGWPVGDGGNRRPARYADVALLMPGRSGLAIYRRVLAERGIPLLAGGANRFWGRDEIRGAVLFLQAAWDPADEAAVVGWLRSPWVGVDDATLLAYRSAHGPGCFYPRPDAAGGGAVGHWLQWLGRWRQALPEVSAYRLLSELVRASGLLAWARAAGDRSLPANVAKLLAMARQVEDGGGAEFVSWLWQRVNDNPPESEADPEGGEGVRFSSVHQAKGLEWPVVVVANWVPGSTARPPVLVGPEGVAARLAEGLASRRYDELAAAQRLKAEAERQRLFYVALTRARDYLLVIDIKPEAEGGVGELLCPGARRFDPQAPACWD